MRLALVGWATNSGVGRELLDALRNLPVSSAFILRNEAKPTRYDLLGEGSARGVDMMRSSGKDMGAEMRRFVERSKPDTVLTWETPGSWEFPPIWQSRGIRWVNVAHWDWSDFREPWKWKACSLISPNDLCRRFLGDLGITSKLLPVPVDTDLFPFRERTKAERFTTIYGYGGPDNRRGFPELLEAWQGLSEKLLVRAQKWPVEIPPEGAAAFEVRLDDLPDPSAIFEEGDIAVQPSRYEGVGVSLLEAQACGLPVITVDAEPMRELAPDLLVPVKERVPVQVIGRSIQATLASPSALRDTVKSLSGTEIGHLSRKARKTVETVWSWKTWRNDWTNFLEGKG